MVIGNSVQNEKSIGKIITGAEQTRPLNNKKEVGSGATEELASSADRSHPLRAIQCTERKHKRIKSSQNNLDTAPRFNAS